MESGSLNDSRMIVDEDVVIKPRNHFSNSALRRVVPQTDLKKKKESLSMSLNNLGTGGRSQSRFFQGNQSSESGETNRHQSFSTISKQISFQSPVGKGIDRVVRNPSKELQERAQILEESSGCENETSSEREDSSSDSDDSDSSIEAAINGEEESEQQLYDKILAA